MYSIIANHIIPEAFENPGKAAKFSAINASQGNRNEEQSGQSIKATSL